MRLLFMGKPGAGKGTQAKIFADDLGIPQISTGDILRAAIKNGTEMGKKAKSFIDGGKLVPDEVVIGIIRDRLKEADALKGFILDGFPRTVEQANALKDLLNSSEINLDSVLNIDVEDGELVTRLLKRAEEEGRADDTEPVIKQRLETYNEQTKPLIDYYQTEGLLKQINGLGELNQITERIQSALKN